MDQAMTTAQGYEHALANKDAEIERLRTALREIMGRDCGSISYGIAKAALEPKP
jgi:hypothetical protein